MINLAELTPYILCSICKGYFIDATTITECLHTFCKSCIVRHFYYSNRCPKCNIVVHQTQPLYNIRLDRQLQDIVYKLVVNLEESKKKQMHDFYKERGLEVPKPAVPQPVPASRGRPRKVLGSVFRIPPELDISILLEFIGLWKRSLCVFQGKQRLDTWRNSSEGRWIWILLVRMAYLCCTMVWSYLHSPFLRLLQYQDVEESKVMKLLHCCFSPKNAIVFSATGSK
ncbi:polycomb group RING finger protein 6 isoform X3 [Meleagris gallopavo]|uniref:polycomb group RING finger protein 6 isoform X3 n=1 Tax=Meleagris gallopavo TaxID=9103 RepID=UPI000549D719|nr:polycomb group RING finger protein 6 isoform X3 [Meleagris gallopavo]